MAGPTENDPSQTGSQGLQGPIDTLSVATQGILSHVTDLTADINTGGAADVTRGYIAVGVGGDIFTGGCAPWISYLNGLYHYHWPAYGNIQVRGSANWTFTNASNTIYRYYADGNIQVLGSPQTGWIPGIPYTGVGGITMGGTAGAYVVYKWTGVGGIVMGGNADENIHNVFTGTGGLVTGGEGLASELSGEQGRGAGAFIQFTRARRKRPEYFEPAHHYIYKGWSRRRTLQLDGTAETMFKGIIPRVYTKPLDTYLVPAETEISTRAAEVVFTPSRETAFELEMQAIEAERESLQFEPRTYMFTPSDKSAARIDGHAKVEYFDQGHYRRVKDDALVLDLKLYEEQDQITTQVSYRPAKSKIQREDQELLKILLD
jgi:hypothetical protein